MIALDIDIEGERLTLLNLYASNEDELSTLELALTKIQEFDNNNVIWGGDLNLVLDIARDKRGESQKLM